MRETFLLLSFLILISPLVIAARVLTDRIDRLLQRSMERVKSIFPAWLRGDERR